MRVGNRNMRIQVGNNAVLFAVVALEMAYREDSASAAPRRRRVLSMWCGIRYALSAWRTRCAACTP